MNPVRLSAASGSGAVADEIRSRRGGHLRPLDGLLLHSPPVAAGWNALLGAIREETLLPASYRELAILRVAVTNRASYEWWAHVSVAREAGLTDRQLRALSGPASTLVFDEGQSAVLALTDAMTADIDVPDSVFDAVAAMFDDRQLAELILTVATYNMVSRFLVAVRLLAPETSTGSAMPEMPR